MPLTVRRTRASVVAGAAAVALVIAMIVVAATSTGRTAQLCGNQHRSVAGGNFVIQNDEWNSAARECISYGPGGPAFSVATTSISMPAGGSPGGYPSVSAGCWYGNCTRASGLPRRVSALAPGTLTSDWSTTQPGGGRYDAVYDIWFDTSPSAAGRPDGAELMIWLGHSGAVRPLGSQQGTTAIDGRGFRVWYGVGSSGVPTVSYEALSPVTSVSGLDIAAFTRNAEDRGYLRPNWYLIDVQAGFELWQGGQGLATTAFSVNMRG